MARRCLSRFVMLVMFLLVTQFYSHLAYSQSNLEVSPEGPIISAVKVAIQAQISGNAKLLSSSYATDAIRVGPSSVEPKAGVKSIVTNLLQVQQTEKPLYFYLRQPQTLESGPTSALVVSNYEAGDLVQGKTVETSGKALYVLSLENSKWVIGAEAVVPNLGNGGYGPLGTSLQAQKVYGVMAFRSLPSLPSVNELKAQFVNPIDQQLVNSVDQVNDAWTSGNVGRLDALINTSGAFSIGDFSPFYIAGVGDLHQHFVDFYKTSKVDSIKVGVPSVRVYGNLGVAAFQFDTMLTVSGKQTHSPGEGMYVFQKASDGRWLMAGCSASMVVQREIGDPYQ